MQSEYGIAGSLTVWAPAGSTAWSNSHDMLWLNKVDLLGKKPWSLRSSVIQPIDPATDIIADDLTPAGAAVLPYLKWRLYL